MPSPANTKPAINNESVHGFITGMRHRMDRLLHGLPPNRIKAIRHGLNLSRADFATRFGLSPRTLEQWECGRRRPGRASVTLLKVIAHAPDVVDAALAEQPDAAILIRTARQNRPRAEHDPLSDPEFDTKSRSWTLHW